MNTVRTLVLDGHSYTIARLTDEQGHAIFGPEMTIVNWMAPLICASLNNADAGSHSVEELALTEPEAVHLISACLELNGLRKKTQKKSGPLSKCECDPQDSATVPNPRLFGMGERVFYLRHLSAFERERLRVVILGIRRSKPEAPISTARAEELADIFACAAGMTPTEFFRSVAIVETDRVFGALLKVSGFPTLPNGRFDFAGGVSSA